MLKSTTVAAALIALASLPAAATPAKMSNTELDRVVAGTDCPPPPPPPTLKGNNGWGNGADPSNPGSDNGLTAPSKTANASVPAAGNVNTNPTTSSGR